MHSGMQMQVMQLISSCMVTGWFIKNNKLLKIKITYYFILLRLTCVLLYSQSFWFIDQADQADQLIIDHHSSFIISHQASASGIIIIMLSSFAASHAVAMLHEVEQWARCAISAVNEIDEIKIEWNFTL